jgi:hypothetical protein
MAFHDRMLAIGDGKQGWKLTDIDRAQHRAQFERDLVAKAVPANVELLIKENAEKRSEAYRALIMQQREAGGLAMPKHSTFERCMMLWRIGLPGGGLLDLARILSLVLLRAAFGSYDVYLTSEMFKCLTSGAKVCMFSMMTPKHIATLHERIHSQLVTLAPAFVRDLQCNRISLEAVFSFLLFLPGITCTNKHTHTQYRCASWA